MKQLSLILFLLISQISFAQTLNFKAEKKRIIWGDSVKLSWKVEKVRKITKIRIKGLKENLSTEGSIYVLPDTNKIYRLEVFVDTKKKKLKKTTSITLIYPKIDDLITNNDNNTDIDSTKICWEVNNADYIVLNDTIKNLPLKGCYSFLFDYSDTVNLKAYNKNNLYREQNLSVKIKNKINGYNIINDSSTLIFRWNLSSYDSVLLHHSGKLIKKIYKNDNPIQQISIPPEDRYGEYLLNLYGAYTRYGTISFDFNKPNWLFNDFSFYGISSKYTYLKINSFQAEKKILAKNGMTYIHTRYISEEYANKNLDDYLNIDVSGVDNDNFRYSLNTKKAAKTFSRCIVNINEKNNILANIRSFSSLRVFRVPRMAVYGLPVKIYWNIKKGYTGKIEGLKNNISGEGSIEITPKETRSYTLIVYDKKGIEVDRRTQKMETFKRRRFVKQLIDFKKLTSSSGLEFDVFSIDDTNYPNEIKLYVLAVDNQGNFVKGLAKANKTSQDKIIKTIVEQSGEQSREITDFTFKEYQDKFSLTYDISLALDYSGSMYYNINDLEKAVHKFISNKNTKNKIAIARFDNSLVKVNDLTANKNTLLKSFTMKGLDKLGGSTALYAGGDYAMKLLNNSKNKKALILFTDGWENSSFQYFEKYAYTAADLAKKAKKEDVAIHVAAFGNCLNNDALQKLAYTTGGNYYKLQLPTDINAVFKELSIVFNNYYVITYRPIIGKGKHSIKLKYNNLKKDTTSEADYQVGNDIFISESEEKQEKTYWEQTVDILKKTPVSVPQAIAYFNFNKDKLLDKYKKGINTYIKYLKTQPNASVVIFGHTDSKGSVEYCYKLSERRANTIKKYMIQQGIDEDKIHIAGCGKDKMIWYPEDKEWKALENRRIEILLLN